MKKVFALLLTLVLILSLAVPASAAVSLRITDNATGNELFVPSTWDVEMLDKEQYQIKFIADEDTASMYYGSMDFWSELSAKQKKELPRKEFNNDLFSKSDIAEILDCKVSDVTMVTLGETEYFQASYTETETYNGYKFTVDVTDWLYFSDGWMYTYTYIGNAKNTLYRSFKDVIATATYGGKSTSPAPTNTADTYKKAVDAYEDGDYYTAEKLFNSVSDYKDSSKYLQLLEIRDFGGNCNFGTGYDFDLALTPLEKLKILSASIDFDFADTAQVLLCNPDVACHTLLGDWYTAPGAPAYAYFRLETDSVGGYHYYRSTNLSKANSDTASIYDGDVRINVNKANTLVFHINLIEPDCMSIYSYETGNCFILYRKK